MDTTPASGAPRPPADRPTLVFVICLLPTAFCLLSTAFCPLLAAFHLPPTTYHIPPTTYHLPPTTYRSFPPSFVPNLFVSVWLFSGQCTDPPVTAALAILSQDLQALFSFPRAILRDGDERGGEPIVEGEEVFDPLAVILKGLGPVAQVNRAIQLSVRFDQGGRHRQRVVKIAQRRLGKFLARAQHRVSASYHSSALLGAGRFRPRVVVSAVAQRNVFPLGQERIRRYDNCMNPGQMGITNNTATMNQGENGRSY